MTATKFVNKDFLTKEVLKKFDKGQPSAETAKRLATIRNEKNQKPVIFIGAGTCGLGAGAGKTIVATKKYLLNTGIDADIIETGCIGLCAAEPLLDVQLPGFNRISFRNVTEDKVESILNSVFSKKLPSEPALVQFRSEGSNVWDNVSFMEDHPFFGPQIRLVLKNCGIINPESIEEYIARGG